MKRATADANIGAFSRFVKTRAADRPLFVPGFVRLLAPRRGLLKGASLGIVSSMGFLRKVVWRSV